ncbi:small ribosomal subunit biogenesis GTPase RsgA 1, mitochondrial-like [Coffea eugenioides]|uniref:small ribosomal subunit biogenesis GTPase RsgA 1, mitochondrial-like n=1 Tax=Coffea eugenioides TaxID=49369 RepID=UPI000F606DB4|nr:small ribosomal subunit biogenesis GTPase RsgA 1, mitochondrial-like [Coffea eugenioides]XP_027151090.1 small ribosomal subunit biogenesis GTPase RsgA 1, mitochondrial-like [Coffea eugenioides]XP_027155543.1 small ribosomal subunit biogenesis GTPase RsgA 1, mitochondrial-like [Coffea eugenioides]
MMIRPISLIRLRTTTFLTVPLSSALFAVNRRHRYFSIFAAAARRHSQNLGQNVSRKPNQPNKNLLKARETVKQLSSLAPALTQDNKPRLSKSQAVGLVAASQANFMRVIVQQLPEEENENELEDSGGGGGGKGGAGEGAIGMELLCVVKVVLKKIKRRVLVGDKVLVGSIDWVDRRGMIEDVFQRKTETADPPVANVDHLLVLFSTDQPKPEALALTRFLVEAESTGIPVTLAFNKSELATEEMLFTWKSKLRSWGYEPIFCSVESKHGIDTLQFNLREQTSVIVGPSGVGKSSLINALRNNKHFVGFSEQDNWYYPILGSKWFEEQRVAEVSTRSGKGKHTTRHVSLLPLMGGGYLADTPGYNQPSLIKVTKQSLAQHFPEIRKMLKDMEPTKCSFSDCLHLGEPGCIVSGDWERYAYYLQLLDEIKIREQFQLRTIGTKKEGDVRYKVGGKGVKQAEPRLEPKKHRRQSRKSLNQSILDELDEYYEDDDENIADDEDLILRAMRQENE